MPPIYAFIPARGGSNRLRNKNTWPFRGRPLATWTLDLARKSSIFDTIYLSTDIPKLQSEAKDGVVLIDRPKHLADDHATLLEVILHTAGEQGWPDDALLALLLVTAPLRVSSDLTEGLRLFDEHDRRRTVVSVSQNLHPPALLWTKEGDHLIPLVHSDDPRHTRKQNHPTTYLYNDILVVDSIRGWKTPGRNLFGLDPVPLMVPPERCVPIDYPVQMRMAEALFPPHDERTGRIEWEI